MMKLAGIYAAALMAISAAGISMGAAMPGSVPMMEFSHSGGRRYAKRRKVKPWKQPMRQHGRKARHK